MNRKLKRLLKNTALINITAIAIFYMIAYISCIPFMGGGKILVGGMLWCIAGIWLAMFIEANFTD